MIRVQVLSNTNGGSSVDWGWGIFVSFSQQRLNPKNAAAMSVGRKNKELQAIFENNEVHYVLDVYMYVKDRLTGDNMTQPGDPSKRDGHLGIVPVVLHPDTLHSISTIQIKLPKNHLQVKQTVETMFFELLKRFNANLPLLHPVNDMEINDKRLLKLIEAQK